MDKFRFCCALLPIVVLPSLTLANEAELDALLAETDSNNSANIPVVLTATRLKQPQTEVPASVTILDRQMIAASGLRNLADLMRLVPGMSVMSRSGNEWVVSYHGASFRHSRRMQVLVDGRSLFQPAMASMRWNSMPVALENIERIEIVRGPDTVAYGANAFLGVINIITRHPADTQGELVQLRVGNRDIQDYYLQHSSSSESTQYRLNISGRKDKGFDWDGDKRSDPMFKQDPSYQKQRHDSSKVGSINLSVSQELSNQDELSWQLAYLDAFNEFDKEDYDIQLSYPDYNDQHQFASIKWEHEFNQDHKFHLQTYVSKTNRESSWSTCLPNFVFNSDVAALYQRDPAYFNALLGFMTANKPNPLGKANNAEQDALAMKIFQTYPKVALAMQPVCGTADNNMAEQRYDLELQDTLVLNSQLRMVSGIGIREDQGDSQTYLNGKLTNRMERIFTNIEYRVNEHWLTNLGAMFEHEQQSSSYWSPRIALNYLINSQQSLRAIYSRAVRTPDMLEQRADWSYSLHDLTTDYQGSWPAKYYQKLQATGSLNAEQIRSHELGYYGRADTAWGGWEWDVRAFYDELGQIISENFSFPNYHPTNKNWIRMHGVESMLVWSPDAQQSWRLTANIQDSDSSFDQETEFTPNNSFSLMYQRQLANSWSLSTTYYQTHYMAQMTDGRRLAYDRLDGQLGKKIHWGANQELDLSLVLQHQLNDDKGLFERNYNSNKNTGYVTAALKF